MSFMDRDLISGIPVREDRRARLLRGTLRMPGGAVIPIVVRNLSERGLGVTCKTTPPRRGDAVLVTLPGSPEVDGVVRWVRDRDFGIELSGAVDAEQLATTMRVEIARIKEAANWKVSTLHRVTAPPSNGPRRLV